MSGKMTRRDLLRYAGLSVSAGLLAACQPKVVKETVVVEKEVEKVVKETVVQKEVVEVEKEVTRVVKEAAPADEQVTITYHCRAGAVKPPASEFPTHQNRLAEFREEHPEINVVREEIAGSNEEYYVKLGTMFAGGTLGDMTFTSQTYSQHLKLAYDGFLAPIDEFMDQAGISDDEWWPMAMDNSYFEGKLYGLPMCLHPGGHAFLFFNQDMFEANGLKIPDGETYTVEDLREAANVCAQGDPDNREVYGYLPAFRGLQCHEAWMRTFGAPSFLDDAGKQTLMDTEEALEWARYGYALYNEDKVSPRAEAIPSGGTYAMFAAGNLAAFQSGTWAIKTSLEVVGDAFKEGVAVFPIGPGGYGACGYLQLKLSGSLPGRADVFDMDDIRSDPIAMIEYDAIKQTAAQYYMDNFAAIEHQQALNAAMDKMWLGEEEPTQAYMDSVAEQLQKILDRPR
jgi:ABC-type glycerol-3-phosphate transport system substrate-binding protein